MFPDLLLNTHNLGPEVRFAPGLVTSHIQIESVEIGEARERNQTANVSQGWKAAENRTEAPPFLVPQIFKFFIEVSLKLKYTFLEQFNLCSLSLDRVQLERLVQ